MIRFKNNSDNFLENFCSFLRKESTTWFLLALPSKIGEASFPWLELLELFTSFCRFPSYFFMIL